MLVVHHDLIKVILNECDDPLMVTGELTEDEGFTMLINHAYPLILYHLRTNQYISFG